jgi:single-stranded-DNA-specific exonuclease
LGTLLNKASLREILQARFANDTITSLSQLPKPDIFLNIDKAANRVKEAVQSNQKIVVVGDYDVDGVTSAAILTLFFESINVKHEVVLPNRFRDGYGLNPDIAKRADAQLLITVDNGISAIAASEVCKSRNIDLIIIDHHTVPEILPHAYAIVHPHFSSLAQKNISAGLVAWYFVGALKQCFGVDFDMRQILDIAALSTIADVMPLLDINRVIVKAGLDVFETSNRPYALAFKELIKQNRASSTDVAFKLAPRLNSAGRLEDASLAYEFLISKTVDEARARLAVLDELNEQRKHIEKTVVAKASKLASKESNAVVVWGEAWNEGVIGIVASRLVQEFRVPAFVISINNEEAKGSARAPKGYDLYSMMKEHESIFTKFGGHKLAAGFSLKTANIEDFAHKINLSSQQTEDAPPFALGELIANELDLELLDLISHFEPFGEGNTRPIFITNSAKVAKVMQVGKSIKYTKLVVEISQKSFEILQREDEPSFSVGQSLNFAYSPAKNEFNGKVSIQLRMERIFK